MEELPELDSTALSSLSPSGDFPRATEGQSRSSTAVEIGRSDALSGEIVAVQAPAPEISPEPVESEIEALSQSEQLHQEMTWMQDFTSSLDAQIRRDDPEQVVSEYLREPTPEQREDEVVPTEEPMPALIDDTDEEEEPLTPEGYGYQRYEEENPQEQAPAPPIGVEPEEEEQEEAEGQEEAEEPAEEEEPKGAEEQDEEIEEEEEIDIEIEVNVEIEIEVEEEEEPVEDELEEIEEDEDEDEWPLGDFEEGEEGELIGPDGEEEQPDDDGWEHDDGDDEDSEASTVTDA